MPRATSPPSLPPDLADGLLDGLRRVSAVADLLACAPPERLLDGTLATAGDIIGRESAHMLALVREATSTPDR